MTERIHNIPEDNAAKRGQPGYMFCVRQAGGASRRRYWVMFKLDDELKPVWTGSVKANAHTIEQVKNINWST